MTTRSSGLTVRAITAAQHSDWIATRSSVSFLQLPEWAGVKAEWKGESVGWFEGSRMVGAGLVLYRSVPRMERRSLAYLPEGPDIDWLRSRLPQYGLEEWLRPLLAHCRNAGAFLVKMGPPIALRRWDAATVKAAMALRRQDGAQPRANRVSELVADWHSGPAANAVDRLRASGWTQQPTGGAGFGDVQPRYVFQLPLADRSLDDIFAGFNQLWRRNIRKAQKAGVVVTTGTAADLADFHRVYVETAERDQFTPRALVYFERMWECLNADTERLRLYRADVDGHLAAATLLVTVGNHAWYSYGASTTADRDVRPSNALQWQMISDAHALGCATYDLRGIVDTLDASNHLHGLVQFKVGTGGFVQEYAGEWDYVLRPIWSKVFTAYQSRRG